MSPVFQNASIRNVLNVRLEGRDAICWSDLDVDLEIDSLRHPERYPVIMKRNDFDNF
uniref:DUF2442 domain-containing protein n=1 Tax=Prevotella sp. TaxID=59823 RepID=UPI0040260C7B